VAPDPVHNLGGQRGGIRPRRPAGLHVDGSGAASIGGIGGIGGGIGDGNGSLGNGLGNGLGEIGGSVGEIGGHKKALLYAGDVSAR